MSPTRELEGCRTRPHLAYTPAMPRPLVPPFAALRAFEAVGRLGGIRRAAEDLGTSHSIVSRHLQALEALTGAPLVDRKAGRLTEAGARYHAEVSAALARIAAATAAVTGAGAERLRIRCAPGLALHWLVDRLPRFRARHPGVTVEIEASDDAGGVADAEILFLPDDRRLPPDRRSVVLTRPAIVPVAAPGFAAAHEEALARVAGLAALPLIEEKDDREWRGWFAGQGLAPGRLEAAAIYGHAHLALAAAAAGQGVALGNRFLIAGEVASGRLAVVTPADAVAVTLGAYVFATDAGRWERPQVKRFRAWLVGEFG